VANAKLKLPVEEGINRRVRKKVNSPNLWERYYALRTKLVYFSLSFSSADFQANGLCQTDPLIMVGSVILRSAGLSYLRPVHKLKDGYASKLRWSQATKWVTYAPTVSVVNNKSYQRRRLGVSAEKEQYLL